MRTSSIITILAAFFAAPYAIAQQLEAPEGWKWVTDSPVRHETRLDPAAGSWLFGRMPPGWHITTRAGAALYEPGQGRSGRYSVESETFLFPGQNQSEYGILLGGRDMEGTRKYVAFVVRRDGRAAIMRFDRGQAIALADWVAVASTPSANEAEGRRVLRVNVEGTTAAFTVNGVLAATAELAAEETSGLVGFRVGPELNLHITTLDITERRAPPRRPGR